MQEIYPEIVCTPWCLRSQLDSRRCKCVGPDGIDVLVDEIGQNLPYCQLALIPFELDYHLHVTSLVDEDCKCINTTISFVCPTNLDWNEDYCTCV